MVSVDPSHLAARVTPFGVGVNAPDVEVPKFGELLDFVFRLLRMPGGRCVPSGLRCILSLRWPVSPHPSCCIRCDHTVLPPRELFDTEQLLALFWS